MMVTYSHLQESIDKWWYTDQHTSTVLRVVILVGILMMTPLLLTILFYNEDFVALLNKEVFLRLKWAQMPESVNLGNYIAEDYGKDDAWAYQFNVTVFQLAAVGGTLCCLSAAARSYSLLRSNGLTFGFLSLCVLFFGGGQVGLESWKHLAILNNGSNESLLMKTFIMLAVASVITGYLIWHSLMKRSRK